MMIIKIFMISWPWLFWTNHNFLSILLWNESLAMKLISTNWKNCENLLPDPVSLFLSIPVLSWAEVAFAIIVKSIASGIKLTAHFWTRMQSPKRTQSIPMSTSFIMIATKIIIVKLTTRFWIRMQSQSGSIHSPHRIRNIIMKLWKKSVKFHLKKRKVPEVSITQMLWPRLWRFQV